MRRKINERKIVVLTGAGVSAESEIPTFRDANGLWKRFPVRELATPAGWKENPRRVLEFYNERRKEICQAQPNKAHLAISELERQYEVIVITQNIDDLHERAGSEKVIHVHGEILKARSSLDENLIYPIGNNPIRMGDLCEKGSQLRPHVVWFEEQVLDYQEAESHIKEAGRVLVVGTHLSVYPMAGLLKQAPYRAEKVIVTLAVERKPKGYRLLRANAGHMVPYVANCWLAERKVELHPH